MLSSGSCLRIWAVIRSYPGALWLSNFFPTARTSLLVMFFRRKSGGWGVSKALKTSQTFDEPSSELDIKTSARCLANVSALSASLQVQVSSGLRRRGICKIRDGRLWKNNRFLNNSIFQAINCLKSIIWENNRLIVFFWSQIKTKKKLFSIFFYYKITKYLK